MGKFKDFLTKEDQKRIINAIEEAELNTSGEIRVHIESKCEGDPVERAIEIFNKLKMYETEQRNAVLLYFAFNSHKIAIIGDQGINNITPTGFWALIYAELIKGFQEKIYCKSICEAVLAVGKSLKEYFPYKTDDVNEQSNEISFGQ